MHNTLLCNNLQSYVLILMSPDWRQGLSPEPAGGILGRMRVPLGRTYVALAILLLAGQAAYAVFWDDLWMPVQMSSIGSELLNSFSERAHHQFKL